MPGRGVAGLLVCVCLGSCWLSAGSDIDMTAVSSRLMAPVFFDERTRNGSSGMRLLRMLSPKIPNMNPTHTATSATTTKMGPQRDRERKESETDRDSARYHILHYVHIRVDFVVTCAMHVSIHPYIHRCRHRCRQ